MGKLIPGEPIVYERVENKVYARYPNRPDIPRWVIGITQEPAILGYDEWKRVFELADQNPIFEKELKKVINLYYLLKNNQSVD